jgi:Aldehyde oxidase and xanthine dehydrogenase, a/b hammerhead domain
VQVTGEAKYTADTPLPPGTQHAALIGSSIPHGRVKSIDTAPARAEPGVTGVFLAADIPGENQVGPVFADEVLFSDGEVTCVGQAIGVVVADTADAARRAALAVQVCSQPPAALCRQHCGGPCTATNNSNSITVVNPDLHGQPVGITVLRLPFSTYALERILGGFAHLHFVWRWWSTSRCRR